MKVDARHVALTYLEAHAAKDVELLARLFTEDIQFLSPTRTMSGARRVIEAIRRLSSVHVRNDLRQLCLNGDEVCLVYDFVTDTSVGIVPTVEWLHLDGDRIRSISVIFDQMPWNTVMEELLWRGTTTL